MATIERLGTWRYGAVTAAIALGAFLVGHAAPRTVDATSEQAPLADTRLAPAAYHPVAYQPAPAPARVVYQRAPSHAVSHRAPARSVKKSVVIIGSSAGVGAGIGAAFGGKKGAGIGALIGGGSAALWDQLTRRK
jgi:hypothetical protein